MAALYFYRISDKKTGEIKKTAEYDAAVENYRVDTLNYSRTTPVDVKLQGRSLDGYYSAVPPLSPPSTGVLQWKTWGWICWN